MLLIWPFSVPEEREEEAKEKQPPVFVTKPEAVTINEGECARFCCRVTGYPRPRVIWIVNNTTVVNVSVLFYNFSQTICNIQPMFS